MTEPKLKPCPFCGGEAKTGVSTLRQSFGSDYTKFRVYCPKCHIEKHGVVDCDGTFEDAETAMCKAVEGWNTRDND